MLQTLGAKFNAVKKYILRFLQRRRSDGNDLVFAPAYDEATRVMANWVTTFGIEKAQHYIGNDAKHQNAIDMIDDGSHEARILIFIGHGKASGLLTKPELGKPESTIGTDDHGCLLDTEDIKASWRYLHVVSWACHTGAYFGPSLGAIKNCGFLGFSGPFSIVINHKESVEEIWKPVMKDVFTRILTKRAVESHDAEWLSHLFLDLRRKIKNGTLDTGIHNRANTLFLKAAAKHAVVHVSKG